MRILIIRHGDPNYEIDSLTEKGWKEAELLADKLVKEPIDAIYVSPMGRAKDTASFTLKRKNMVATECDWLREFGPAIKRTPDHKEWPVCWDWKPIEWENQEIFFDRKNWKTQDAMRKYGVDKEYDRVIACFDQLLAKHGYVRDGEYYRAERPSHDTIALFCHFGLQCVLLSRLMNVSPMVLWHHYCAAPTSVTTVLTEERDEGTAVFRCASMGDVSHLYVVGEKPAFSARWCETFTDPERH